MLYGQQAPTQYQERGCYKVHVYAAASLWGRTSMFTTVGTTGLQSSTKGGTAEVYKQLLEDKLIPACRAVMKRRRYGKNTPWIFQQDNAKPPKAKVVQDWLAEQDFEVMNWPSRSPDLSWIENLWAYVSRRLSQRTDLTADNFEEAVKNEWANIPDDVHYNTVESIYRRLRACIKNNGGSTKY